MSVTAPAIIQLTDGAVSLDGRPILRHIDLTVREGEFVALMGANGSGKSTLVRTLTGLWPLSAGTLELFGTPLQDFQDWQRLGFVPQRSGAVGGVPASVGEVVASGRLTHRRLFAPLNKTDKAAIASALDVVGLADRAQRSVAELSGGQQQRVLIARALASEPDLLFLDEPTAGVDLPSQETLAETLAVLAGLGRTIVLVAHELGPLQPLITRTVVMSSGRIEYDGAPLDEREVHDHSRHHHHHDDDFDRHDHAPHVAAPFDNDGVRR